MIDAVLNYSATKVDSNILSLQPLELIMRFPLFFCLSSLLFGSAATVHALPLQSNHGKLQAVPVVKPVVVDGALDEWDTSAGMLVYCMRKLRDRHSVRENTQDSETAIASYQQFLHMPNESFTTAHGRLRRSSKESRSTNAAKA